MSLSHRSVPRAIKCIPLICLAMALLGSAATAWALSVALPTPDIRFPADFNPEKVKAIETVLCKKQFQYLGGLYSDWEPAFSSTLVYEGNTDSLLAMVHELGKVQGMHVKVTVSRDLSKETGSALRAGSWWVIYSHVTPDVLTVRVNLAAKDIDISKLVLDAAATQPDR